MRSTAGAEASPRAERARSTDSSNDSRRMRVCIMPAKSWRSSRVPLVASTLTPVPRRRPNTYDSTVMLALSMSSRSSITTTHAPPRTRCRVRLTSSAMRCSGQSRPRASTPSTAARRPSSRAAATAVRPDSGHMRSFGLTVTSTAPCRAASSRARAVLPDPLSPTNRPADPLPDPTRSDATRTSRSRPTNGIRTLLARIRMPPTRIVRARAAHDKRRQPRVHRARSRDRMPWHPVSAEGSRLSTRGR